MKKHFLLLSLFLPLSLQAGFVQLPSIERVPEPENLAERCAYTFPNGQPKEKILAPAELDVRSCDISSWDLRNYTLDELADVLTFDNNTTFPSRDKLPLGFTPLWLLRNSRNEGLHIDKLHRKGYDGQGVAVAVIDQNLLVNHREYDRNLIWYEEDSFWQNENASDHGTAIASLLVGRTLGIAPRAKLFHFAVAYKIKDGRLDALPFADALEKIIELNSKVPSFAKIRAVSISRGFDEQDNGYEAFESAKNKLEKDGVAVFTTDDIFTLSRIHAADSPDLEQRYCRPAYWLDPEEYVGEYEKAAQEGTLLVPTDYHTAASPTDIRDYAHYATGGLSWGVPYVVGLYALGVQADKTLTKEKFLLAWEQSSTDMPCLYSNTTFTAKNFARPGLLIKKIEENAGKKPSTSPRHRTWWKGPRLYGPRTTRHHTPTGRTASPRTNGATRGKIW